MTIRDLIAEAKRLLQRWARKNLPNYAALGVALEAIPEPVDGAVDTAITELRNQVKEAWIYEYAHGHSTSGPMTYVCVAVSLIVMFALGSMLVVYNQGTALLSDMEKLSATKPDRRFGQLERQLLVAQSQLFSEQGPGQAAQTVGCTATVLACEQCTQAAQTTGCIAAAPASEQKSPPTDDLAHEASYGVLHDLKDLDVALGSLQSRMSDFEQAIAKLYFVWPVAAPAYATSEQKGGTAYQTKHFCPTGDQSSASHGQQEAGRGQNEPQAKLLGMDVKEIQAQACKYSLTYTSMAVPSVDLWAMRVKKLLEPYSNWVLPGLFACLGAMVYFLRLLTDATERNPTVGRVLHRMALAALGGMIVGWFWEPAFGANSEFKAVGFGLFTLAFIIGFSIEVFFTLLDRLVKLATNAIDRLGTQ
jgi:hypothetical protein